MYIDSEIFLAFSDLLKCFVTVFTKLSVMTIIHICIFLSKTENRIYVSVFYVYCLMYPGMYFIEKQSFFSSVENKM